MAGDLGKIGSEGFHMIDNYYAPCKCKNNVYRHRGVGTNPTSTTRQGRFGVHHHHHHQGHINNNNLMMREENEGVIINNREAAMKYNGINVEAYHHHHHKPNHSDLPKSRWGKIFFFIR